MKFYIENTTMEIHDAESLLRFIYTVVKEDELQVALALIPESRNDIRVWTALMLRCRLEKLRGAAGYMRKFHGNPTYYFGHRGFFATLANYRITNNHTYWRLVQAMLNVRQAAFGFIQLHTR
jgi:hypothetical protein